MTIKKKNGLDKKGIKKTGLLRAGFYQNYIYMHVVLPHPTAAEKILPWYAKAASARMYAYPPDTDSPG